MKISSAQQGTTNFLLLSQVANFSPGFLLRKQISQVMIEIFLLFPLVDWKEAKLVPFYNYF